MLASLSFDDGYLNHIYIARLLARMGVKATFYCITHLDKFEGKPLLTMHPEHIKEISDLGHEVGSHTCTHQDLTNLSKQRLEYELKASRLLLEDITGEEIVGMAYPYGYFNAVVLSKVSEYYHYARSAGVYEIEDMFNTRTNKYMISTMTKIHDLPKLYMKALRSNAPHPVSFLHDTSVAKVFALILSLKMFNAHFVTVKKLVDHLERERTLHI